MENQCLTRALFWLLQFLMAFLMVSGSESADACLISMSRKPHTDFILDAAHLAAKEPLLDQMCILTSRESHSEFLTRLEQPGRPNELLRNTMQTPVPWDKT